MTKKAIKEIVSKYKMHKYSDYTKKDLYEFVLEDLKKFNIKIDENCIHILGCNDINCYCFELQLRDNCILKYDIAESIPRYFIKEI